MIPVGLLLALCRRVCGYPRDPKRTGRIYAPSTQEEFEAMGILGIHLLQGFFFAEPVKLPGAEKVLFPETGVTQEKASR